MSLERPRFGLALGSGAARGWAHIGVIRALQSQGIEPDIVCGTSAGALVGAAFATGHLDPLEAWIRTLAWKDVVGFLDIRLSGGLIGGRRLFERIKEEAASDGAVESLPIPFTSIATDLETGNEVWLRTGPVVEAVRASTALPGLFPPVRREGRWLVDGGLVNPVPISACRALGADVTIAVDLNTDLLNRWVAEPADVGSTGEGDPPGDEGADGFGLPGLGLSRFLPWNGPQPEEPDPPPLHEVINRSINIMSVRITRSRMAGDPPDILLSPSLADIGLMEFHRAAEAIAVGHRTVERSADIDRLARRLRTSTR